MSSLPLEGATLGQRHRWLNQLTNETVRKRTPFAEIQNLPEISDLDRFYKIDVAAQYRHLDYILDNLKSEDSLYMSRALNKSTWLVTDPLYAEIISPDHLENALFPKMTSKAIAKTLLFVRLHLKDEARAELFYKYVEYHYSKKEALKWLPICSIEFIEGKALTDFEHIDMDLFKRLCDRSFKVFEIIIEKSKHYNRSFGLHLRATKFLLNTHMEEFLKQFEDTHEFDNIRFGKKSTAIIIKKCFDRVMNKLKKYLPKIHMVTFAKSIDKSKIKEVMLKINQCESLTSWFSYNHLETFAKRLPEEEKFEFIVNVFVKEEYSQSIKIESERKSSTPPAQCSEASSVMTEFLSILGKSVDLSDVYWWYRMAPFDTAFHDLKNFIQSKSISPYVRREVLTIFIKCAGNNPDHIFTLIQHFCDKYAKETVDFKSGFISSLLKMTDTHVFEDRTWMMLENIFNSLNVYVDSEDDDEICDAIRSIVAYSVLHDKRIPEIIIHKFMKNFTPYNKLANKLYEPGKTKLFDFLFNELKKKIDSKPLDNTEDFDDVIGTIMNLLDLLKCWGKKLIDFPYAMNFIKYLIENKSKCNVNDICLQNIYNMDKKWRRDLFNESLQLVQNEAVYMNALKHKPEMILQQRENLDIILKSNSFDLIRILTKLRIYFPDNFAADWLAMYEQKLESFNAKAATRGLCILMERERFTQLLQAYVPESFEVKWSEEDTAVINLRKFFAQQMYLVRPTLHVETVLLFAKRDYLQYTIPSLTSICLRRSKEECKKFLPALLGGSVSLQKHGIRLAFEKFETLEATNTFMEIWSITKNASIRAIIFKLLFRLLNKEKNSSKIPDLWGSLEFFMKNLSPKEDQTVFTTMAQVGKVPEAVRAEFCMLSYKILMGLPADLNCEGLAKGLLRDIAGLIDTIDEEFVTQILLNYVKEVYAEKKILQDSVTNYGYDADVDKLIARYIICSPSKEVQNNRYLKVFKAITEHSLAMWNQICEGQLKVRTRYSNLVSLLEKSTKNLFNESEPQYIIPTEVFSNIQRDINQLTAEENYMFLTRIKLAIAFCESYLDIKSDVRLEVSQTEKLATAFAKRCLRILKDDVDQLFLSIYALFADALKAFISRCYECNHEFKGYVLREFAADRQNVPANLVVVKLLSPPIINKPIFKEVEETLELNENRGVRLYLLGLKHHD